ncbi:MAG: molybdate ABC transporter substrate-binding protein [Actinomycetota bacterium]|nr:molybdate ABC transporter substrate-binding protein [Actinomycetota bacterium]
MARFGFCLVAVSLALAACGQSTARPQVLSAEPRITGRLTTFAAASLTESFDDLKARLRASSPGLSLTYSFGGSGALATQIQQGAPADVVATADTASMKKLTDAGLVDAPMTFARNKLEILVESGNPKCVRGLSDLSRGDLKVVLADETVPAGKYSAQALSAAGVTVNPASKEGDVKSAVARVITGEADATVVYVTDVSAVGPRGQGVAIPDAMNIVAEYPIAVVRSTGNPTGATAFVNEVVKGAGQDALHNHGFLAAP